MSTPTKRKLEQSSHTPRAKKRGGFDFQDVEELNTKEVDVTEFSIDSGRVSSSRSVLKMQVLDAGLSARDNSLKTDQRMPNVYEFEMFEPDTNLKPQAASPQAAKQRKESKVCSLQTGCTVSLTPTGQQRL